MDKHQSRFKAYLIPKDQLGREALLLQPFWESFQKNNTLSATEKAGLFLLIWIHHRRPHGALMTSGNLRSAQTTSVEVDFLIASFPFLKPYAGLKLLDIFLRYRPRQLPGDLFEVISLWGEGLYLLDLYEDVPEPFAMLESQASGRRIVTLSLSCAREGKTVDGSRDAFEFLMHDLIHASLFFKNRERYLEQKNFFTRLMFCLRRHEYLKMADQKFTVDLNYLMADMNSCVAHLESHWRAILVQWRLRQEKKEVHEILSQEGQRWVESGVLSLQ